MLDIGWLKLTQQPGELLDIPLILPCFRCVWLLQDEFRDLILLAFEEFAQVVILLLIVLAVELLHDDVLLVFTEVFFDELDGLHAVNLREVKYTISHLFLEQEEGLVELRSMLASYSHI